MDTVRVSDTKRFPTSGALRSGACRKRGIVEEVAEPPWGSYWPPRLLLGPDHGGRTVPRADGGAGSGGDVGIHVDSPRTDGRSGAARGPAAPRAPQLGRVHQDQCGPVGDDLRALRSGKPCGEISRMTVPAGSQPRSKNLGPTGRRAGAPRGEAAHRLAADLRPFWWPGSEDIAGSSRTTGRSYGRRRHGGADLLVIASDPSDESTSARMT